ncbi:unnamed protein product [Periconia digitata]|uniref:Uncharacterized protein n=1 Tax=Periconia digitata TaxID=1303443 RepID=A0A9W4XUA4_9PLEO|nr:unnamed protein product [Periconia digitata]
MAPVRELAIKLSGLRYKHPDISEKDFHDHSSKNHAANAAAIQQRHGALKVSQVRNHDIFPQLYPYRTPTHHSYHKTS